MTPLLVENAPAAAMAAFALERPGRFTLIAKNDRELAEFGALIRFMAPGRAILELPAWDCEAFGRLSPSPSILANRAATLVALASGSDAILLTTINALMQKLPPPSEMREAKFKIAQGSGFNLDAFRRFAAMSGFHEVSTARQPGEFALRGGIVDLILPGSTPGLRLDLFGDVIDGVRSFDPETQRSKSTSGPEFLSASSELLMGEAHISRFRQAYRALVGVPKRDDIFYEAISNGVKPQGSDHLIGLFYEEMVSLVEYLPKSARIIARADMLEEISARFEAIHARKEARGASGILGKLEPSSLYLDEKAMQEALARMEVFLCSPAAVPKSAGEAGGDRAKRHDANARLSRNFSAERAMGGGAVFHALKSWIDEKTREKPVIISCNSEGSAERLSNMLAEYDIKGTTGIASFRDAQKGRVASAHLPLAQGFENERCLIISEADILGERVISKRRAHKRAEAALVEAAKLSTGDYIVHREHGIGRFLGMETLSAAGAVHECLTLEYAGGDRLFLPVENIDLISPHGEEKAALDRLGTSAWQERKARAKKDLLAMAEGLMRIAAKRAEGSAPVIEADRGEYEKFAASFPFEETDDQLQAIEESLSDMASGKPMDRLICGDVGFGKTEIALRTAFVAAMSGYQVALIAPTTLLSRQHSRNFRERFGGTPLRVEQLSRFVSQKDVKARKKALAEGRIDIIIGTHALLAEDISFQNLGLLIIDEEQHFGVKHKERLKALRSNVHVLTLSATPIPRTLQLALAGVRELSIIATPPVDRLAIRSYVCAFDPPTIRDALLHEKLRGGQSFYVVPRIADIAEIEEFLRDHCPEVSFITAHGQMPSRELDERVNDFYDGKADCLLATTIVESGLDIPSANTLIVHRADMFGLAQLHQIRGRVGRAKIRAFAYLTTKKGAPPNPAAQKRLEVLSALDALGSGFSLASHDLDLRGAGNLLGEEQSGQIREIGFALYQSMLKDAIRKLRSGEEGIEDQSQEFSPEIALGVSAMIPGDYVHDTDMRLSLYRRLGRLRKRVEIEEFAAEMIDRFGPIPGALETLLKIVRIKAIAKKAGIERLEAGEKGAVLRFYRNNFANPAGLVELIGRESANARVKDRRLIFTRHWPKAEDRLAGAHKLAKLLARIASEGASPPAGGGFMP